MGRLLVPGGEGSRLVLRANSAVGCASGFDGAKTAGATAGAKLARAILSCATKGRAVDVVLGWQQEWDEGDIPISSHLPCIDLQQDFSSSVSCAAGAMQASTGTPNNDAMARRAARARRNFTEAVYSALGDFQNIAAETKLNANAVADIEAVGRCDRGGKTSVGPTPRDEGRGTPLCELSTGGDGVREQRNGGVTGGEAFAHDAGADDGGDE